jgi:hypothetical protein
MLTDKSDELSWSLSRNGSSTGQTIGERFLDTSQEFKMSTSVGGVFTGRGADMIILDEILQPDYACPKRDAGRQTTGTSIRS